MKLRTVAIGSLLVGILVLVWYNLRFDSIAITPLEIFAKNCTPCEEQLKNKSQGVESNFICTQPPTPPDEVIYVLDNRLIDDQYAKWVLLIYLKLYEKQRILTHQTFETRATPFLFQRFKKAEALSRAFCQIVGTSKVEKQFGPEFLSAEDAYDFIKKYRLFPNDEIIQDEIQRIDKSEASDFKE